MLCGMTMIAVLDRVRRREEWQSGAVFTSCSSAISRKVEVAVAQSCAIDAPSGGVEERNIPPKLNLAS